MLCGDKELTLQATMIVVMILEWWLGRTKKVESNSTIDLVLNILLKIKGIIYKESKNGKGV